MSNWFRCTHNARWIFSTVGLFFFLCQTVDSQSQTASPVPAQVLASFNQKYPNSLTVHWKNLDSIFIAEFTWEKKKIRAGFISAGKWVGTVTRIRWSRQLPSSVRNAFNKSPYSVWRIESISQYEWASNTFYRLGISNTNLLDGDHHDSFLKNYCLDITDKGIVAIEEEAAVQPFNYHR